MKRRITALILLLCVILGITGCETTPSNSKFEIYFIDVGQGDSALIECDGRYMLIDGGDIEHGNKVRQVLMDKNICTLDVLVISHMHQDHFGGLIEGLKDVKKIRTTFSNQKEGTSKHFPEFSNLLHNKNAKIKVPSANATFNLGSAQIEVLDVSSDNSNASLVLLITYQNTTFLFTGDMEQKQERNICEYYNDKRQDITLLKVAHHGSDTSTSIRFLNVVMPQYAIISVGENNKYAHPSQCTLDRLQQADVHEIYRTDQDGDIVVRSDGESLDFDFPKAA